MAGTDAIAATSEAIRSLLQRAVRDSPDFTTVDVTLYQSNDLQDLLALYQSNDLQDLLGDDSPTIALRPASPRLRQPGPS